MVSNTICNTGHILDDTISKLAKDIEKTKPNDRTSYMYRCALLDGGMWSDTSP